MARITSLFEDEAAGFEAQQRDLKAAGVERLFSERTSAVGPRKALEEALDFAREGDAIVVTKLDRLARSVADLVRIVERQRASGCASSRWASTPRRRPASSSSTFLVPLGSSSARSCLKASARGVQRAKRQGKYKGRAPTARAKSDDIIRLAGEGVKREDIAKRLGVGVASVYRVWRLKGGRQAELKGDLRRAGGSGRA